MRRAHPFLDGLRPTLLIAHRGGAALRPENTLPAFEHALHAHGADVLELDVHLSRDGELVVAHDATLERCTDGEGPLAERTWLELQRLDAGFHFSPDGGRSFPFRGRGVRQPSLRDVLRAFPGARLNLEAKPDVPGVEDALARLLRDEGAVGRVCVGSELDAVAERLVRALPEACHFYPRGALEALVGALQAGATPPDDPRYQVLDVPLEWEGTRIVDAALLQAAAGMGKWVNVWTVDAPEQLAELVAQGVGGVMTDRPDVLRRALEVRAGR